MASGDDAIDAKALGVAVSRGHHRQHKWRGRRRQVAFTNSDLLTANAAANGIDGA